MNISGTHMANASQLANRTGVDRKTIKDLLKAGGVKPLLTGTWGRGECSWYESQAAEAAIREWVENQAPKAPKAPASTLTPTAPVVSLAGIEAKLAMLEATNNELRDQVAQMCVKQGQLMEQNRVLLATMRRYYEELTGEPRQGAA